MLSTDMHLVSLLMASAMALGETPFLASAACSSSAFAMSSGDDGLAPITFSGWFELIQCEFLFPKYVWSLHLFNLQGLCQLRGREVGRVEGVLQGLVDEGRGVIACKEKGKIIDESHTFSKWTSFNPKSASSERWFFQNFALPSFPLSVHGTLILFSGSHLQGSQVLLCVDKN